MRQISFHLTRDSFLDGSKDVTRRFGWSPERCPAGTQLMAVNKCQALKKAEEQKKPAETTPANSGALESQSPPPSQFNHNVITMSQIPADSIVPGLHVRQTKPDQGRQIFGTAMVLARKGDLIEVRNGGGKKHWIDSKCLEVVTAPISTKAAGEAA